MEVGAAPLQAERPPSIAEPHHPIPPAGSDAPKEHSPMLPEPQAPRSPLDLSAGKTRLPTCHRQASLLVLFSLCVGIQMLLCVSWSFHFFLNNLSVLQWLK